jgi:NADH-quinone oxidoreductase subunit L
MGDLSNASQALRWIPLLPLIAAAASGAWLVFARRQLPRLAVIALACGAPILSFAISIDAVLALADLPVGERFFVDRVYAWFSADPFHAELSFLLDPLSAAMALVVTGVGSLIHVYAVGYMDDDHRDDRGFQRFFVYLNLFMFAMLMLVLGDNLLVMFVGWEGVGLCSYLLIGFWFLDDHNGYCGQKAFVVNRIGDFGFLLGIFLLFQSFAAAGHPTVEFREMAAHVQALAAQEVRLPDALGFLPGAPDWRLLTLAGLLLFVGAAGKSAQIPLYVWLPDAMAGPTPVSALIHAATMVTAGVYMVCRMSFLYSLAPGALATVAWAGGLTAFFAATIGLVQRDIKKVLAYSTVSQLGYMFLAAGAAAYTAAIFHLVTHAFFKALLFLGAGSVILGMHHEQDILRMGGLRRRMPWTHWTFLAGVLAIAGVPLLSGFFSKDEILLAANLAHEVPGHGALYALGLITAALTAFYMFRLYFLVFTGESRAPAEVRDHVHEQAAWILLPLVVLAVLSVTGGLIGFPQAYGDLLGMPGTNGLAAFLDPLLRPAHHTVSHATEYSLALLATLSAGAGIGVAALLYRWRTELAGMLAGALAPVHRLLDQKYWVDELYDLVIVGPLLWVSDRVFYRTIDAGLIDRVGVDGTALAVRGVADRALKFLQTGLTQSYVLTMIAGGVVLCAVLIGGCR